MSVDQTKSIDQKESIHWCDQTSDWVGIHYSKGRMVMAFETTLIKKCILAYAALQLFVAVMIHGFEITLFHGINYALIVVLLYFGLVLVLYLRSLYNHYFNPLSCFRIPFFLWLAIIAMVAMLGKHEYQIQGILDTLMDHELWLRCLKESVSHMQDEMTVLDGKLVRIEKDVNNKYNELLRQQNGTITKMDEWVAKMWKGFGLIEVTRKEFGLGCFENGTLIAVAGDYTDYSGSDYDGSYKTNKLINKKIEDLNENDLIFNPILDTFMNIKVMTKGPEDGSMYEFMTDGNLVVSVTQNHPMLICKVNEDMDGGDSYGHSKDNDKNTQCNNVAASNVYAGNWTRTINGFEKIIKISQKAGNNNTVYNIMLDMYPLSSNNSGLTSVDVTQRGIIANGIFTLDLYAQSMNE